MSTSTSATTPPGSSPESNRSISFPRPRSSSRRECQLEIWHNFRPKHESSLAVARLAPARAGPRPGDQHVIEWIGTRIAPEFDPAPVAQSAEAGGLNPLQHGFESHRGHSFSTTTAALHSPFTVG